MRTAIVTHAIDTATLLRQVASAGHGATSLFLGTVRDVNDGRAVTGIEYAAYEAMADAELRRIATEASARFGTDAVVIEHRIGELEPGDVSVAIAVSHAHRANALDATRFVIEELKRRVPIWKREHYADGTREWVDSTDRRSAESGVRSPEGALRSPVSGLRSPEGGLRSPDSGFRTRLEPSR